MASTEYVIAMDLGIFRHHLFLPSLAKNVLYEADRPFESGRDGSPLTLRGPLLFFLVASLDLEPPTLCISEFFSLTYRDFLPLFETIPEDGSEGPLPV